MYNIASKVKKHRLYSDFQKVKTRLAVHQFVCWIAGGAVRDFCLNREVNEFDLVTDASTEVLKILFPEALLVGESFGVLKIPLENKEFFDLTTFRQESDYTDGRRPSQVSSATPVKDAERRDFTINALFWDDYQELILDYQGGLFDLQRRMIACVGKAEVRFAEDYLRIMRLVRFSAQLNFEIEKKTGETALLLKSNINRISGERVWAELKKIDNRDAWNFAIGQKLFSALASEIFETNEITFSPVNGQSFDIFLYIYLMNPEADFSDILKKKLHVSNQELSVYHAYQFLLKNDKKISLEELAYELEKSPQLNFYFNRLTELGLIEKDFGQQVQFILKANSVPLIVAKDLLELIPHRHISEELKNSRLGQFRNIYKTKADVIEYLGKKYAKKPEKT